MKNRFALKLVEAVVRFIYRNADVILIQSEGFRESVGRLASPQKIRYFPNPGEVSRPSDGERYQELVEQIPDECFSVVFAGNLGTVQALDTLLDAAALVAECQDVRIVLVGDGSRALWVRDEIRRRGLRNVLMLGRHPAEAMPALFERASALLVSLCREPIFALTVPSKVQAYLAAGRPIIASLNGEGGRIVREAGAGLVCPAGDPVALADAIRRMASLPAEEREAMGEAGRRYHKTHFDLDVLARELLGQFCALRKTRG